jgi:mono/diheme cytochrome c family protein
VTIKNFRYQGKLIETRFYVRHPDGEYSGYSYAWRKDGSDADLVEETTTKKFGDMVWTYPGRNQCNQCHTAAAGRSLGLELRQLDIDNSLVPTNQLDALGRLGMLSGSPRADEVFGKKGADVEAQARAYLHVNCSICHRPGGAGRGGLDLRFGTSLADSGLCQVASQGYLGTPEGRVVAPGKPNDSVLLKRVGSRGQNGMPPLASGVVDEKGVALLSRYIESLGACP